MASGVPFSVEAVSQPMMAEQSHWHVLPSHRTPQFSPSQNSRFCCGTATKCIVISKNNQWSTG